MTDTHATKSARVDAGKAASPFQVPGFGFEAVAAGQRRLIQAVMEANTLAIQGWQALMRQQLEFGRQAMDQFSTMARDVGQANGSVKERFAKQAEYAKQAIETGLSNARATGALLSKAGTDALTVVGKRATESVDDVRDDARKRVAAD